MNKQHKESCHHKNNNDTLPSDVRCRCICTCPTVQNDAKGTGIKKAILFSIEGGWKPDIIQDHRDLCHCEGEDMKCVARRNKFVIKENQPSMFLDPSFWQCLGKSMGWNPIPFAYRNPGNIPVSEWNMHWYHFINHLAEGKDAESFFNQLLK